MKRHHLSGTVLTNKDGEKLRVVSGGVAVDFKTKKIVEITDEVEEEVFEIRTVEGGGVGMFARLEIPCGVRVWEEEEGGCDHDVGALCWVGGDTVEGRVKANGFEPGGKLFMTISRVNHSCTPNCQVVVRGTTATLHTCTPILPGTELTISYINLLNPTPARQSLLQENCGFTCTCHLCTNPTTTSDAARSRLATLYSLGPTLSFSTPEVPHQIEELLKAESLKESVLWADLYRFKYIVEESDDKAKEWLETAYRHAVGGGGVESEQTKELTELLEGF